MARVAAMIRRHGTTVLLTGALIWLFVDATLPALEERDRLRAERSRAEQGLRWRRQAAEQRALWIRGAEVDPFVQERLRAGLERSPALPGPRVVVAPPNGEDEGGVEEP